MINSESDFLKFALSKYDNPHLSSMDEFLNDLKRFTYINTLVSRYSLDPKKFKDRLVLNHFVILGNCFTVPGVIEMSSFKLRKEYRRETDTFLYFLGWIDSGEELNFDLLRTLESR